MRKDGRAPALGAVTAIALLRRRYVIAGFD
jgi:hypothetical protein